MSEGNSMILSDAEFDEHHAHRCVDCEMVFSQKDPVAEETPDGDLCADCAAEREMQKEAEE